MRLNSALGVRWVSPWYDAEGRGGKVTSGLEALEGFDQSSSAAQATETNDAQSMAGLGGPVLVSLALADETDDPQAVVVLAGGVLVAIGLTLETDESQPVATSSAQLQAITQVFETGFAQPINSVPGLVVVSVGQATSVESAGSTTVLVLLAIGLASETDSVFGVTGDPGVDPSPIFESKLLMVTTIDSRLTMVTEIDSVLSRKT